MIPSLGRIVHVTLPESHKHKGAHRAAVITQVYENSEGEVADKSLVDVTVFLNGTREAAAYEEAAGFLFLHEVPYAAPDDKKPGTWHEPERIEPPKKKPEAAAALAGAK